MIVDGWIFHMNFGNIVDRNSGLPHDEGRTGGLVGLPVLLLALLGAVGNLLADAGLQFLIWLDLAEVTRGHLSCKRSLKTRQMKLKVRRGMGNHSECKRNDEKSEPER